MNAEILLLTLSCLDLSKQFHQFLQLDAFQRAHRGLALPAQPLISAVAPMPVLEAKPGTAMSLPRKLGLGQKLGSRSLGKAVAQFRCARDARSSSRPWSTANESEGAAAKRSVRIPA